MFGTTGTVFFNFARTSLAEGDRGGLPYDHVICARPFAQKGKGGLPRGSFIPRPAGYSTPNAGPAAEASARVPRPAAA